MQEQSTTFELPNCPICLIEMTSKIAVLPCRHTFHSHCIQDQISKKKQCPICRAPSNANKIINPIYDVQIKKFDESKRLALLTGMSEDFAEAQKDILNINKKLFEENELLQEEKKKLEEEMKELKNDNEKLGISLKSTKAESLTLGNHLMKLHTQSEEFKKIHKQNMEAYNALEKENSQLIKEISFLKELAQSYQKNQEVEWLNIQSLLQIKDDKEALMKRCMSYIVRQGHLEEENRILEQRIAELKAKEDQAEENIRDLFETIEEKDNHLRRLQKIIERSVREEENRKLSEMDIKLKKVLPPLPVAVLPINNSNMKDERQSQSLDLSIQNEFPNLEEELSFSKEEPSPPKLEKKPEIRMKQAGVPTSVLNVTRRQIVSRVQDTTSIFSKDYQKPDESKPLSSSTDGQRTQKDGNWLKNKPQSKGNN